MEYILGLMGLSTLVSVAYAIKAAARVHVLKQEKKHLALAHKRLVRRVSTKQLIQFKVKGDATVKKAS